VEVTLAIGHHGSHRRNYPPRKGTEKMLWTSTPSGWRAST
jgi:hypothetical protein